MERDSRPDTISGRPQMDRICRDKPAQVRQNGGHVSLDRLHNPAEFDELLSDREASLRALEPPPTTDLGRLRRVQILFAHDATYPCIDLEAELDQLLTAPVRGTRLMLLIEQRLYEEVARVNPDPISADPLELEDASRAHAMVGIAALNLDRPHVALEHLRAAIALARAVGTKRRVQAMQLDWHRARVQIDEPDLPGLDALLMQPDLTDRVHRWAQRLRAQALLELGAPEDALRSLGITGHDGPQDAAQREFLHALLNLPPARVADDPLLDPALPYNRLARAYRTARNGKRVELRDLRGRPFEGYARLIEARSLLNLDTMADTVLTILGTERPSTPGQTMLWSAYRITAALKAGHGSDAHRAVGDLSGAMMRLRNPGLVADVLLETNPTLYLTLALGPFSQILLGVSEMTLLVGQVLIDGPNRIKLPGRTGRALVLEGAGHIDKPDITRSERKRLADVLVGFPGVINVGVALRYAQMLYDGAVEQGAYPMADMWAQAYRRLHGLLSLDVQSMFAPEPSDSLL